MKVPPCRCRWPKETFSALRTSSHYTEKVGKDCVPCQVQHSQAQSSKRCVDCNGCPPANRVANGREQMSRFLPDKSQQKAIRPSANNNFSTTLLASKGFRLKNNWAGLQGTFDGVALGEARDIGEMKKWQISGQDVRKHFIWSETDLDFNFQMCPVLNDVIANFQELLAEHCNGSPVDLNKCEHFQFETSSPQRAFPFFAKRDYQHL